MICPTVTLSIIIFKISIGQDATQTHELFGHEWVSEIREYCGGNSPSASFIIDKSVKKEANE